MAPVATLGLRVAALPDGASRGTFRVDVITEHRLRHLDLCAATLEALAEGARALRVYEAFLDRIPYENLSNNLVVAESPDEPDAWPRATDRLLRDNALCGLGGTSFSLAYALADLLRGAGLNAHTTLGYNLVTEQAHAAVIVYVQGAPLLFDPALLVRGAVPVRPGGNLQDPLGLLGLEPRCGATLTVTLTVCSTWPHARKRAVYSLLPVPAPPPTYRQSWLASFRRGRTLPLRIACRRGDVIWRYGERPHSIEILSTDGRQEERLPADPVPRLVETFGIDGACLESWFRRKRA